MQTRITAASSSPAAAPHMRGIATRPILITLLLAASGFMAYRLLFVQDGAKTGSAPQRAGSAASKTGGATAGVLSPARQPSATKREENGQIDPSLRLDLLNNSRAVSYTGSKRNIFVIGVATPSEKGNGASGERPVDPKAGTGSTVPSPPVPPSPPPVVIPLKFYGIAERSGTGHTKALLTNGDTIVIAQAGQTVAQHFKILRIGMTKLDLEDIRDHSTHEIPLEEGAGIPPTAGPSAAMPSGVR
jgi:hypothetical protein